MSVSDPGITRPDTPFKVGIAMAVYLPVPEFLEQQLRSIQEQTWRNWVCIMTWDTQMEPFRADKRFAPFVGDIRFVWVQNDVRLGGVKNFEKAAQLACSHGVQAIAFADQDDVWYSDKLAVQAQALRGARPLSLVHCDMDILANGRISPETVWAFEKRGVLNARPLHLFIRNVVSGCATLFDADLARKYPAIPQEAGYHDYWYALAAATHGGVVPMHRSLAAYRQHGGNALGAIPYADFALELLRAPRRYLTRARENWIRSEALLAAAEAAGMKIPFFQRLVFAGQFGFGLFVLGIWYLWSDPKLARQSFSLGIGKIVCVFTSRPRNRINGGGL